MQGLGNPGSNIWSTTSGPLLDCSFMFPGYAGGGISGDTNNSAAGFRFVNRMFPQGGAVINPQHSAAGHTVPRLNIPETLRGRIRQEGLLCRARTRREEGQAGHALVRRGAGQGHPRPGSRAL
jgi:hypothetical protein